MDSKLGFSDEFTETEYAAIGRLVRAFTELEHELASITIFLSGGGGLAETDPEVDKQYTTIVGGAMRRRLEEFSKTYRKKFQEDTTIDQFEDTIRSLLEWRNAVFHGKWSRGKNGLLKNVFYPKEYVREKKEPPEWNLSTKDLDKLNQHVLFCAAELKSIRNRAEE